MKHVCTRDKIRKATENPNKEYLEPQIPSLAQLGEACHVFSDPSRNLEFHSLGRPLAVGTKLSLNPKPK